ncbi:MAG: thiamine phosphate synthase [Aphanocapsa sp. GSE-SYN-MK-11-07L]|jgi:thiamine-phosphate pyrophosphorylase|nr:thiamine phosphate synthase [Aphanocapsa sp. GSE-SYN-MK-11-07L]
MQKQNNTHPILERILDANLDRAREGLRVIEEWCRFGLERADLTATCKHLRQQLGQWHRQELRLARNTPTDPGTALTHPQEQQRSQIQTVLQVNLGRVQESLRVLEEYGKLYDLQLAAECKQMRYQVYSLESQLLSHDRLAKLRRSPLYLVTSPSDRLLEIVEAALKGGLTLVQYRSKTADDTTRLQEAEKLAQLCHQHNALFILNDRVDLAVAVNADGVHLGQQDIPIALARQMLGPQQLIGRSTTNPTEMERAIAEGADYIGVGPVYETPTKAGKAAAGLEYIHYAVEHAPVPWYAIGGIDASNLSQVVAAGATHVAVVRAIMQASDPTQATQALLAHLTT